MNASSQTRALTAPPCSLEGSPSLRSVAAVAALAVVFAAGGADAKTLGPVEQLVRAFLTAPPAPAPLAPNATAQPCFTPGHNCARFIADVIDAATRTVQVQAYHLTSREITDALLRARRRGVDVVAIVDKSQRTEKHSKVRELAAAGIPVLVDEDPDIAHHKVIVLDPDTSPVVVTGSFNFTQRAQNSNAENVLILRGDPGITRRYADNFAARRRASKPL